MYLSILDLADALANPIAYQSMVEKHAHQLMALTDDVEVWQNKLCFGCSKNQNALMLHLETQLIKIWYIKHIENIL